MSLTCFAGYSEFYDQGVWNQGGKPRDDRCTRVRNKWSCPANHLFLTGKITVASMAVTSASDGSSTPTVVVLLIQPQEIFDFPEIWDCKLDQTHKCVTAMQIFGNRDANALYNHRNCDCVLMLSAVCVGGPVYATTFSGKNRKHSQNGFKCGRFWKRCILCLMQSRVFAASSVTCTTAAEFWQ